MKRDFKLYIKDILDSCVYIEEFVSEMNFDNFNNDIKTKSAVVRQFEIIGEAIKNISEDIREKYPNIKWKALAGMRDKLIHGYFGIDYYLVWDTIKNEVPVIKETMKSILNDLEFKIWEKSSEYA